MDVMKKYKANPQHPPRGVDWWFLNIKKTSKKHPLEGLGIGILFGWDLRGFLFLTGLSCFLNLGFRELCVQMSCREVGRKLTDTCFGGIQEDAVS